jgi:hypothetical protein
MIEQACPYQDVRTKVMLRVGPEKLIAAMETIVGGNELHMTYCI